MLSLIAIGGMLLAAAPGPEPAAGGAEAPVAGSLSVTLGWAGVWDRLTTSVPRGGSATDGGALAGGLRAELLVLRRGWLGLDFWRGATELTTAEVSPGFTAISAYHLGLAVGYALDLSALPPLGMLVPFAGWSRYRVHAERQTPTQLTPSWTRDELLVGCELRALLADAVVQPRARLALVPWAATAEDYADNGTGPTTVGLELGAGLDVLPGPLRGPWGEVLIGADLRWAGRWTWFEGQGARRALTGEPVREARQAVHTLTAFGVLTWRYPASAWPDGQARGALAGAGGGAEEGTATVEANTIRIDSLITFRSGSDEIDMARSRRALAAVARLLKAHPELARVEVQGHTDNVGDPGRNQELSQRRAEAVVRALGSLGVAPERLVARGYGDSKPIAANDSEAGRAKNRRVEFQLLR